MFKIKIYPFAYIFQNKTLLDKLYSLYNSDIKISFVNHPLMPLVLEKTFKFQSDMILIYYSNEIIGYFNAVNHKKIFSSKSNYLSFPGFKAGKVILRQEYNKEFMHVLNDIKDELNNTFNIYFFEQEFANQLGFHDENNKIYTKAVLEMKDEEELFTNFKKKLRWTLRKVERDEKLIHSFDNSARFIEKEYYPFYLKYMKQRHGSPPLPITFFLLLNEYFKDDIYFSNCYFDKKLVSSVVALGSPSRVELLTIPCNRTGQIYYASDKSHWELIRKCVEKKIKYLDFGPAWYEGQKFFKEKWGCNFLPYYGVNVDKDGVNSIIEKLYDSKARIIIAETWKRLIPVPLTPYVGYFVRKYLL